MSEFTETMAVRAVSTLTSSSPNREPVDAGRTAFAQVFSDALAGQQDTDIRAGGVRELRLSAHAQHRMEQRGLRLTTGDWMRLQQAVAYAEQRGARDAYLVYGDAGLVVNVPNRTVVTVMENREGTTVTQIDSVVFVTRPDQSGGRAAGNDGTAAAQV